MRYEMCDLAGHVVAQNLTQCLKVLNRYLDRAGPRVFPDNTFPYILAGYDTLHYRAVDLVDRGAYDFLMSIRELTLAPKEG